MSLRQAQGATTDQQNKQNNNSTNMQQFREISYISRRGVMSGTPMSIAPLLYSDNKCFALHIYVRTGNASCRKEKSSFH